MGKPVWDIDRKKRMQPFCTHLIAHRGLFDNTKDYPENSCKAFQRAVQHGFGIEMDVQTSADGELVVFHDDSLQRACGVDGILYTKSYAELQALTLFDSHETIPRFEDVLALVDGRVPIIVEIKANGPFYETTQKVVNMLAQYGGAYCIESFHPLVPRWLKRHRPDILRGLIACRFAKGESGQNRLIDFCAKRLWALPLIKADFVAYRHEDPKPFLHRLYRKHFHLTSLAWTVQSQSDIKKALRENDGIIFDSFIPDDANIGVSIEKARR